MELHEMLENMDKKHDESKKMTSMLCMLLKASRHDVTANEQWQQKFNEKYQFYPPRLQDALTDLIITLENTPKEDRTGLIKAIIVRYFSVTGLLKLRDLINEIEVQLLTAAIDDKELAETASPFSMEELLKDL